MSMNPSKSTTPAILVAFLAAIGASVCCVLPLALVLMGISGAWIANLTAMDVWRPWFSAATLLCLAAAFWGLYGPSSQCGTDGVCFNREVLTRRRRWLWLAAIGIALMLLFPYYVVWFV